MWKLWPPLVQDIVRANSLIIMFAVSYFWLTGTNWKWYLDFYKTLPQYFENKVTIIYLSVFVDIVAHLLPVIILGLPIATPVLSVGVASICILVWYLALRHDNKIQKIYIDTIPIETYDIVVIWGIGCAVVITSLMQMLR